nr:MAG TPA: Stage 0 sporulation protein A/DNA, transcriptional activation and repression.3A [Bacteriophage sp.]
MNKDFQQILEKIAKDNNTTPENVYREMQIAIDAAFDNQDLAVRKNWEQIHYTGDRPTPEDVIYGIGLMLKPEGGMAQ